MDSSKRYRGFRTLPTEILVSVFEHGGRAALLDEGMPFAIKISHVSRLWRIITHGTPSIWSSIPVDPLRRKLIAQYLERSGAMPLDVCLHFKSPLFTKEAMDLLLVHRHRWVNFYLRAGSGTAVFPVISSLRNIVGNILRLRHFEIIVTGNPGTVGWLPTIFNDHPPRSLKSVVMHGVSFDFRSSMFTSLTRLTLAYLPRNMGSPSYVNFRDLLGMSRLLQYLKLDGVFPKLVDGITYAEIDLPALTTLDIVMNKDQAYVPLFFEMLSTPSLATLRFQSKWNVTWDGFEDAIPEISAKCVLLRNLSLSVTTLGPLASGISPNLFGSFPLLRELSLTTLDDDTILHYFLMQWVAVLGPNEGETPLYDEVWPTLELLTIRAPFDEREHEMMDEEETIDDALETIGSLRMSRGQPFDVYQRYVFADFAMDPLDTE